MTRWPSSSDSWLSKNAPLSRRFSKKRLMDCSSHAERPPESVARDGLAQASVTEALKERTRARVPLGWATNAGSWLVFRL